MNTSFTHIKSKTNPLSSFKALASFCKRYKLTLPEAALYYLLQLHGSDLEDDVKKPIAEFFDVYQNLYSKLHTVGFRSESGLIVGVGPKLLGVESKMLYSSALQSAKIACATMEATASGKVAILANYTCGAAGTFPGIIYQLFSDPDITRDDIIEVFLIHFAIGVIANDISSIAGARGMCSAETGNSSAGAAAAMVFNLTKDITKTFAVVERVIRRTQGVPCDPICGGLVEVPCLPRNGVMTLIALNVIKEVMAEEIKYKPDPDHQLKIQKRIGDNAPIELKETSLGGTAATPGAIRYHNEKVKGKIDKELSKIIFYE